jgi:hypothetical protein
LRDGGAERVEMRRAGNGVGRRIEVRRIRHEPMQVLAGAVAKQELLFLHKRQAVSQLAVDRALKLDGIIQRLPTGRDPVCDGPNRSLVQLESHGRFRLLRALSHRRRIHGAARLTRILDEVRGGLPRRQERPDRHAPAREYDRRGFALRRDHVASGARNARDGLHLEAL